VSAEGGIRTLAWDIPEDADWHEVYDPFTGIVHRKRSDERQYEVTAYHGSTVAYRAVVNQDAVQLLAVLGTTEHFDFDGSWTVLSVTGQPANVVSIYRLPRATQQQG
jgi:hypothetical protein